MKSKIDYFLDNLRYKNGELVSNLIIESATLLKQIDQNITTSASLDTINKVKEESQRLNTELDYMLSKYMPKLKNKLNKACAKYNYAQYDGWDEELNLKIKISQLKIHIDYMTEYVNILLGKKQLIDQRLTLLVQQGSEIDKESIMEQQKLLRQFCINEIHINKRIFDIYDVMSHMSKTEKEVDAWIQKQIKVV